MPIILDNINFQYPGTDIRILNNINCAIAEKGFHGLFGPSGVGKTTFAKIIGREIKKFSGTIKFGDIKLLYT